MCRYSVSGMETGATTSTWRRCLPDIGPGYLLLLVVAAAMTARGWLLFSTPLVPGMNGGYYPVQARAVLTAGHLGIPDLPLTFYLQAATAKVLQWLSGASLDVSVLRAVKLCDMLLPPLAAVGVYLLGRHWSQAAGRKAWLPLAAAAFVVLCPGVLLVTGDLQKNSLALVWLAGLAYALNRWLAERTGRRAALVLLALGLLGLTHIGVFGCALLLTALVLGAHALLVRQEHGSFHRRIPWRMLGAAMVVVALAAGVVLWKFDPARVKRLTGAFVHPLTFLRSGQPPMGNGPSAGQPRMPMAGPSAGRQPGMGMPLGAAPAGPGMNPPFPDMQPPGGMPSGLLPGVRGGPPGQLRSMPLRWMPTLFFAAIALTALVPAWRRRHALPAADAAVTAGCALTVLALTGPWVQGDVAPRFHLIAILPAALAGLFALLQLQSAWLPSALVTAVLVLSLSATMPLLARGGQPTISPTAFEELQWLAALTPQPERTLIVARHGLEWWASWALHTHVAQPRALKPELWTGTGYRDILRLGETGGPGPGPGGMVPPGLAPRPPFPPSGPFHGPPQSRNGAAFRGDFAMPGPPPVPDMRPPGGERLLHEGANFRLVRLSALIAPPP